jgi:hypothetical protein
MALIRNAFSAESTWRSKRHIAASGLQRCAGALRRALIVPLLSAAIAAATAAANSTANASATTSTACLATPVAEATGCARANAATAPSAAERVMASELAGRSEAHDALSMMVSSVVRMVQAGRRPESRWQDS